MIRRTTPQPAGDRQPPPSRHLRSPMRRVLVNLTTLLSLLLCAAAATMWARSHRRLDRLSGGWGDGEWSAAAARGKIFCFYCPDAGRLYPSGFDSHDLGKRRQPDGRFARVGSRGDRDVLGGYPQVLRPGWLGFAAVGGTCTPCVNEVLDCSADPPRTRTVVRGSMPVPPRSLCRYRRFRTAVVPLWTVGCAGGLAPSLWLIAAARGRRCFRQGSCMGCGYDLRATPDRCPECGRPARCVDDVPSGAPTSPIMPAPLPAG